MKKILLLLIFACARTAQEPESQILSQMMKNQTDSWNAGNLEGFMSAYWNSDSMTFQSGSRRMRGWDTLLAMYQTNYAGEQRGILTFSDLEFQFLSDEMAYVLGRWHVKTATQEKEGVFTLIWRKFPEGWRIVHDHSS